MKLKVLVEDCGDGDLAPFFTDEETLAKAQEQVNAIILHEMIIEDEGELENRDFLGRQNLATALNSLLSLSHLMRNCDIEDVLMRMFQEGMKAGMQYERDKASLMEVNLLPSSPKLQQTLLRD